MENKMMVMRRALRDVSRVAEEMTRGTMTGESVDRKTVDAWAKRLCEIISRDLAIPLRQCDVGTPEEQERRFRKYCETEECNRYRCGHGCKAVCIDRCVVAWAQMPYAAEEGGAGDGV